MQTAASKYPFFQRFCQLLWWLLFSSNLPFWAHTVTKKIKESNLTQNVAVSHNVTPRQIDFNSASILRRYVDTSIPISVNFCVISRYYFDVILRIEKSTSFLRTFFDVISLVEKSTLLPRSFFDVILMVEKSALFPRTFLGVIFAGKKIHFSRIFYDVILMVEKSILFQRIFFDLISLVLVEIPTIFLLTFFDVILIVEKSTLFARTFSGEDLMGKISTSF